MSRQNLEKATILVLADSQPAKEYLKEKLDQMNIEMIDGQDEQTSQLIGADSPDLIILDIAAPQQVCLDVLQVLRQEKTRPVPLMIYAGQSLKSNDIDKMTLAFTRHVSSSHMSEPQFLGTVRRLLDGRLRLLENQTR
jgi:response regulator RpfG family c-di-GMP phosphodiesterase